MTRRIVAAALGLVLLAGALAAQEGPERGRIKKIDAAAGSLILTVGDKDVEVFVVSATRLVGPDNQELKDGLRSPALKEGVAVVFKAVSRDGKDVLLGLKLVGDGQPGAPGGIGRARIKKLDLDRLLIVLTVDGKDLEFPLTEELRTPDVQGKDLKERLKGFKEGGDVQFLAGMKDGKPVLLGLRAAGAEGRPPFAKVDTSGLKPLTELGAEKYQGFQGGLYPGGKNERPKAHEAAGLELAKQVVPRDAEGRPAPGGKIVLLSVGMSNTSQVSEGFQRLFRADRDRNPAVVFVNGAQGGMTAAKIKDPNDNGSGQRYWAEVERRLQAAGVSAAQVQVVWIKEADAGPTEGFPGYARKLEDELAQVARVLHDRFPNLKLCYLSSRTYGGYAKTPLNPEPYAYESGFSVKWLIEKQIEGDPGLNFDPRKGPVKAPWLSWGPYLWANGSIKRADGFSYDERDFSPEDGTHLSASGVEKTGRLLLEFFKNDTSTRIWFNR
jgi:Cu/Ag efflux protein CusF